MKLEINYFYQYYLNGEIKCPRYKMHEKLTISDSCGNVYTTAELMKIGKRSKSAINRMMNRVIDGKISTDALLSRLKKNKEFIATDLSKLIFIGKADPETGELRSYTVKSIEEEAGVNRITAARRLKKALNDPSYEPQLLKKSNIGSNAIDRTPSDLTEEQRVVWDEMVETTESCKDTHD